MNDKTRTNQQNKALHLFFTMLAENLNEAGYDMRKTLKPSIDIPWNTTTIKEFLWRPIQKAQLGKESTTDLTTKELDMVLETLTRHLGEKLKITQPFPSIEEIMWQQQNGKNLN